MRKILLLPIFFISLSIFAQKLPGSLPVNGLHFYFPFDGNTKDESGNNINSIPANLTLTSDRFGKSNAAYSFNGINSSLQPNLSNTPQPNDNRTITGWFKVDQPISKSLDFAIINYGESLDPIFKMSFYSKGYLDITFGKQTFSSQKNYFNNQWTFFALTFNDSNNSFSLYINNVLELSGTVDFPTKIFGDYCRIGYDNQNNYFEGTLDDIAVWNRVLTSEELSGLYYTSEPTEYYTLIPDVNFEKKLIELGIDSGNIDGKVLTSAIASVGSLDVSSSSIYDLKGIEDFTDLQALYFQSNSISYIDLSKNTKLIGFNGQDNKLVNINLSGNNHLQQIHIDRNNLMSLDITQCTSLFNLNCEDNQLTTIDLSQNKALSSLYLDRNRLKTLNISKNTELNTVWCGENQLSSVVLPESNNLEVLYLNDNKFTALNISKYTNLKQFVCSTNQLNSIDVSANTQLTYFHCQTNNLTELNVTKNPYLTSIYCFNNQLKSLDLSQNKDLETLWCHGNQLTSLDVSQNKVLAKLSCHRNNFTNLNVKNGNNANMNIYTSGFTSNPNLTCIEVDNLDFANTNWSTKKDATADFSTNCSQEYTLIPDSNFEQRLIDLGIDRDGKNGKVSNKSISNLTSLNLNSSSIRNLTGISGFISLKGLKVSNNDLISLDLSKNILLDTLNCSKNKLITLNLKNGNNKNFYSKTSNFSDNPNLTCIQVDDATYSNTNWASIKDATANYNTDCPVVYALLPDSNFEQKLIDLGIDTDGLNGKITIADASSITTLDLSNSNIKDLTGIENFTALTYLDCSNNQITSLDLSQNVLLETLNASSNQITSLDLSKNSKLTVVYVLSNPLEFLNLQNGNNKNIIIASQTGKTAANTLATTFLGLNKLGCVKVDDVVFSNANWSKIKESTTTYSSTCSLGIEDSAFNKVVMYPNPTKGEININNISLDKATVYNSLGQLVKSFTLNSSNTDNTINLSGLPKGVYYIYLINGDAASAKKIILE